ncbi:cryptochrome DASH [Flavobacterium cyanobacteriorum]|uniref:Cryptochrome DASH n=1 Tax=Flavobacterium cyanobacteriorum TaxID=2022802 RepID=A0A255Z6X2_9FLAO|nr:DASH family cryptochrome [Flavobacterium cyanobacteriorum]OYQ36645.1 cryptochrome DASH [Flavobacterium cyanobacteriorum]
MPAVIVWFKTDLRLHDNEALVRALSSGDTVVPVYCFDDSHFGTTRFGFRKTGDFRIKFLMESLTDLDAQLRALGSGLLVVKGDPATELYNVAKKYNAKKVFAKKEVAFEEKATEEKVTKQLWKLGCSFETYSTSTLYHAEDLPFSIKDIPDVFTNFRKKTEKESIIRPLFSKPPRIVSPVMPPLALPEAKELGGTDAEADERASIIFRGGETEGLARLNDFIFGTKAIATYKETRDGLTGRDFSSKLSPWLAFGCLSPREVYSEVKRYEATYGANKSTYWLIFELLWRDYFRFMMKKHKNKLFLKGGFKGRASSTGIFIPELLQQWADGQTGNDFVDANMRELKYTGFMSNRGRQNVASYLCNDLGIDWRYGAAYFEQQLVDYDASSNWGNWAYIAGVGNDPRENRKFNVDKQAADYDPKKIYRKLWLQ